MPPLLAKDFYAAVKRNLVGPLQLNRTTESLTPLNDTETIDFDRARHIIFSLICDYAKVRFQDESLAWQFTQKVYERLYSSDNWRTGNIDLLACTRVITSTGKKWIEQPSTSGVQVSDGAVSEESGTSIEGEDHRQKMIFEAELNRWIQSGSGEGRVKAAKRIRQCWKEQGKLLDLSVLGLTTLPDSICSLSQLQVLDVSNNQLQSLPASIGLLSELQKLNLSFNYLPSLPDSIGLLSQLQELNLSYNQLRSLPDSISCLSELQVLNVSNNQLRSLPDSIGLLSKLQRLDVSYNQLPSLPGSIALLKELKALWVVYNSLSSLPSWIHLLPGDCHGQMYGNPFSERVLISDAPWFRRLWLSSGGGSPGEA
jgi:Leucine-rich repeat (LRR) protein